MKFLFSFNIKKELIFIDGKSYVNDIGSISCSAADISWDELKEKVNKCFVNNFDGEYALSQKLTFLLENENMHPAITEYLIKSTSYMKLQTKLEQMKFIGESIRYVFEVLVDEPQYLYEEILLDIYHDEKNKRIKDFIVHAENAVIASPFDRLRQASDKDFTYLFETNDINALILQELSYLLLNKFFIRKCANCKRFIVTRKTNKLYCKRIVPNTNKTCAQYGPIKLWIESRPVPYKLYCNYRTRLFNQHTKDEKHRGKFHTWVKETESLKDKAKRNEISVTELKDVLDQIEKEIYFEG